MQTVAGDTLKIAVHSRVSLKDREQFQIPRDRCDIPLAPFGEYGRSVKLNSFKKALTKAFVAGII
jgi:hypothetical protein